MGSQIASASVASGGDQLIEVLRRAKDLGVLSEELARAVFDAESELALSRQRHCLLRPVKFRPGDNVLEVGGKYGALARYLGEIGAEVQSVDDDIRSMEIARLRCRDLANVNLFVDLQSLAKVGNLDWVVLTEGVSSSGQRRVSLDSLRTQLAHAYGALAESGSLIFSTENRLGLKYLLGAKPTGSNDPFEVLNSTRPSDARPIDLALLMAEVRSAGFVDVEVLLPFPDHLFPKVLVRAPAVEAHGIPLENVLWGVYGRDYAAEWYAFIDEQRLWAPLQRNGIAASMAHSLMIVARKSPQGESSIEDADAWRFTIGDRYSRFMKSITISCPDANGSREVQAAHILPDTETPSLQLESGYSGRQVIAGGAFHPGVTEAARVAASFGHSANEVVHAYVRWASYVFARARCMELAEASMIASWVLPGDCAELIPQNMIWPEAGVAPFIFDNEPQFDQEVPLVWVLYRGVIQCMRYHDPVHILRSVAGVLQLTVVDEDVDLARRLEREMVNAFEFPTGWTRPTPIDFPMIRVELARLEQRLSAATAHSEAILSRKSVRLALGLARRLRVPLRWWRSMVQ